MDRAQRAHLRRHGRARTLRDPASRQRRLDVILNGALIATLDSLYEAKARADLGAKALRQTAVETNE